MGRPMTGTVERQLADHKAAIELAFVIRRLWVVTGSSQFEGTALGASFAAGGRAFVAAWLTTLLRRKGFTLARTNLQKFLVGNLLGWRRRRPLDRRSVGEPVRKALPLRDDQGQALELD
jgi:hypothetical protein